MRYCKKCTMPDTRPGITFDAEGVCSACRHYEARKNVDWDARFKEFEGHDKPLKYPLMFQVCDVVLVNKIDVLPYFDFDMDKCREYVALRNPNARVIPICARTGEGIDEWADWLKEQVRAWQA